MKNSPKSHIILCFQFKIITDYHHSFPTDSKAWCNMVHARYAVFITYITCVFLLLPTYFSFTIKQKVADEFGRNHTLYQVNSLNSLNSLSSLNHN